MKILQNSLLRDFQPYISIVKRHAMTMHVIVNNRLINWWNVTINGIEDCCKVTINKLYTTDKINEHAVFVLDKKQRMLLWFDNNLSHAVAQFTIKYFYSKLKETTTKTNLWIIQICILINFSHWAICLWKYFCSLFNMLSR